MNKISLSDIKSEIAKSGANRGKILYFKENTQVRVRFLTDFEEGLKVIFHDSFKLSVNYPCQEQFGRECPGCDSDDLRTRAKYCWVVYDYESKEVKLLLEAVNQCSPVGQLSAHYETYGTLTDRDYIIKQVGSQTSKTFAVMAQEKRQFRGKAKPLSEKAILQILDKAYPCEDAVEEEDETDEPEWNKNMKPSQLYKVCQDRGIDAKPKQPKSYYIEKLEQDDEEKQFEEESETGDEWGEEEGKPDYESMKAQELYKLCRERNIECEKKKTQKYYIDLLEKADEDADWIEGEEDEWGEDGFMNIPDGLPDELPFN